MQTRSVIHKGKTIVYDLIGAGYPAMLVHGFGEDRDVWRNQVNFLKDKFQLIVPDLPGSGDSEFNPDLGTVEAQAEAMMAILDAENITRCTILGHSMGGYITLAIEEKFPGRVDAFGLVHSSSFADNEEKTAARRKSIEFIRTNGSLAFLKTSTPGLFSDSWKLTNPEAVEMLIDRGRSFLPEALVQYYELMIARPDRLAILEKTAKPVLFIIGQYDNAIPFTASMQQCHVPAKSHIHILRHSGHMGMWEEPQNTNAALAGFLGQFPALA